MSNRELSVSHVSSVARQWGGLGAFLTILFLSWWPLALLCWYENELGMFRLFASDAFYYLSVARHSQGLSFFSADGLFPTSGFHPLWQFILSGMWWCISENNQADQLLAVFLLSSLLTGASAGIWGLVIRRATGSCVLALLGTTPGIFYLIFGLVEPFHGNTWSFCNGMETGISLILFTSWYAIWGHRGSQINTPRPFWLLAMGAAMLTIARLDDIFLFFPLALGWYFTRAFVTENNRPGIGPWVIAATIIGLPLAHNLYFTGSPLPVSGISKTGFALLGNLKAIAYAVFPVPGIFPPEPLPSWSSVAWRVLQLIIPMGMASFWLVRAWNTRSAGQPWVVDYGKQPEIWHLAGLAVFVLTKGGYHLLFTELYHQGHWYFPLGLFLTSLWLACWFSDDGKALWVSRENGWWRLAAVLAILILGNSFVQEKRDSNYNLSYYKFWINREHVDRTLEKMAPGSGIVEFDDGIQAMALVAPTLNAFGLTLDAEAAKARSEGWLLRLAWRRGFRVISSLTYIPGSLPSGLSDKELNRLCHDLFLGGLGQERWGEWSFRLLFKEPLTGCPFIAFEPKGNWETDLGKKLPSVLETR